MPHSAFTKRHGSKSELRVKRAPTRAILSRPFGAISSVRPRGPHEKIGPHFANGRASQAISRAGRLEKSVLSAVTGDEKAVSRDL
jgi:hypothetical protein